MNDLIETKSSLALYNSLLGEAAKSQNELKCAQRDVEKALTRMSFILLIINALIDREAMKHNLTGD